MDLELPFQQQKKGYLIEQWCLIASDFYFPTHIGVERTDVEGGFSNKQNK
jgi:hypothetical protein